MTVLQIAKIKGCRVWHPRDEKVLISEEREQTPRSITDPDCGNIARPSKGATHISIGRG